MVDEHVDHLAKAREALQGAESELANRRYNNAANRAYYACFHAAIAALIDADIRSSERWEHDFVQARFAVCSFEIGNYTHPISAIICPTILI